jgi:SAM-dependent methyltransferase
MGFASVTDINNLRERVGRRASRLGERLGFDWLTYNRFVVSDVFHPLALHNAPPVVGGLIASFPHAQRVLDVGCGSGAFAAEFRHRGRIAAGCERSCRGIALARMQGVPCVPFDLRQSPPAQVTGPFDLVYCFEVAEHLPPILGKALVQFLSALCPLVVFSAAIPGQGGIGHINEQPVGYWMALFEAQGFFLAHEETETLREEFRSRNADFWFFQNSCVFRKAGIVV